MLKRVKVFVRTVPTHPFSVLKFFVFEGPVSSFDEESQFIGTRLWYPLFFGSVLVISELFIKFLESTFLF